MSLIYELHYHPAAVQELVDIGEMIAAYAGNDIALKKLAEIEKATNGLIDFPFRASIRVDFDKEVRVVPAGEKAVVWYTVDQSKQEIFIAGFGYAGSDWASAIKDRL